MWRNNKGFTLTEVVIASMILFSAISVGALVFRTAARSLDKIALSALFAHAAPQIIPLVREELIDGKQQGENMFGDDVSYSWQVTAVKEARNIISAFDEMTGGVGYGNFKMVMYQIDLSLRASSGRIARSEQYSYQELVWGR